MAAGSRRDELSFFLSCSRELEEANDGGTSSTIEQWEQNFANRPVNVELMQGRTIAVDRFDNFLAQADASEPVLAASNAQYTTDGNSDSRSQQPLQQFAHVHEYVTDYSLPHAHAQVGQARDIRKLYDDFVSQDSSADPDQPPDPNSANGDYQFDESKAEQILAIQSEIDEHQKQAPEQLKKGKRKRPNVCSNEVLLAALKRWQPTRSEWSELAKHLRNIRGGVIRLSDLHRKMELIKSQGLAATRSSSRLQACSSNAGMELVAVASATGASNLQIVRKDYGSNHWNVELVLVLLLNFVELSVLLEEAIMETLKIPTSLVKLFICLLRGNATEFQLRLAKWSKLGHKQLVFGLDLDGLQNVISGIAVAFLTKLEIKMTSAKVNEVRQRILSEVTAAHESRQLFVANSLFAARDLFSKLMELAATTQCAQESRTFPTSQAVMELLCSKVTNLHYFGGRCPSCEQIRFITGLFRNTADAENVRVALLYKHFSEFFHFQKYAFRHLPVALLPHLSDPDIQQSIVPVSLQKQIAVIRTENNHFFTMLYAGIQPASIMSSEEKQREGLYHSIEFSEMKAEDLSHLTVVMTATAAFDWLKVICIGKEEEMAQRKEAIWSQGSAASKVGPAERNGAGFQLFATVAYSGSFRGLVGLANEGFTAGVFNVNTWFYSLSITSSDRLGDNVFTTVVVLLFQLKFVERLIFIFTDGSPLHDFCRDPYRQDPRNSILERMIQFLGIRTRFQLTLEVQPLAKRNSELILFDGESLHNRIAGNLRLRNAGLITRGCIDQLFSFGQYAFDDAFFCGNSLTTLNLSYCDLSVGDPIPMEQRLQYALRNYTWPTIEMNLDDTKLQDPRTVEVLFDVLCHRADSRFLAMSLNKNPGLGNALFEKLFDSRQRPGALHFPFLRLLSVSGCLSSAQLQQIHGDVDARATRNTGRTVRIVRYEKDFFDRAGIPIHNYANDAVLTGESDLKIVL